jgi:hypothetical protein
MLHISLAERNVYFQQVQRLQGRNNRSWKGVLAEAQKEKGKTKVGDGSDPEPHVTMSHQI